MEDIDACANECSGDSVRQTNSSRPNSWNAGVQNVTMNHYSCLTSSDTMVNIARSLMYCCPGNSCLLSCLLLTGFGHALRYTYTAKWNKNHKKDPSMSSTIWHWWYLRCFFKMSVKHSRAFLICFKIWLFPVQRVHICQVRQVRWSWCTWRHMFGLMFQRRAAHVSYWSCIEKVTSFSEACQQKQSGLCWDGSAHLMLVWILPVWSYVSWKWG